MKRIALFAAALFMLCSCSKEKIIVNTITNPIEAHSHYVFDGVEYPVYTALYNKDNSYHGFIISPKLESPYSTYFMFLIHNDHIGKTMDLTEYLPNFDFIFRYEDPMHYYAEYLYPEKGSLCVKEHSEGIYTITLQVTYEDGKSLAYQTTASQFSPALE